MVDEAVRNIDILPALERSINKVLKGYNIKSPAFATDKGNVLTSYALIQQIKKQYGLSEK
jgi:hypothetical protein